jgi:hypothetical protein
VAYFEENLRSVLATLEKCQASLIMNGDRDTAQLVSVAILDIRIKLNRIEASELKALCEAMQRELDPPSRSAAPKSQESLRPRAPVSLKLVK